MQFFRFILPVFVIVALFVCPATAQEGTLVDFNCSYDAHYAKGSTFEANLKSVLSLISANNSLSSNGFFTISVGQDSDKVNAMGLCRGDISLSDCNSCMNFSVSDLPAHCPTQKEAIIWYDSCMLRYSNQSIFGTLDPMYYTSFNDENVSNPDQFNQALSTLLSDLRDQASLDNSSRKFATGHTNYTNFGRVYALVQCTLDLSGQDCGKCLDWAFKQLSDVSVIGGRVFCGSCNLRFEIFQFYASTGVSLAPLPSTPPTLVQLTNEETSNTVWIVIISVLSTFGLTTLIVIILLFVQARWKKDAGEVESTKALQFDLVDIKAGTDNFSDNNKLGEGGFGAVYQGRHVDGQLLAVKRLAPGSGQGDIEFKNEVLLLTKLQHKNLVRLLGFCLQGEERLLIYEFMPNGSLDQILFDHVKRKDLDWEKRYKIIGGIARGMLYLHEDSSFRVIHRDLKASNVLLDEDMTPKIADFGLARLFSIDQTRGQTNKVIGTYGYMAPEYRMHGCFSVKSDVYSFGVLMLELVSGRKNTHIVLEETAENLISFSWESWRAGTAPDIIDLAIRDGPRDEIMQCIHIGLLCVQESVALRPNMAWVVALLNGLSVTLPPPTVPAFYQQDDKESGKPTATATDNSGQLRQQFGKFSTNEISYSDMYPR